MDQSIQRHDDVLQREASAQECIFYDSILVTLLQLQRNDSDKDVAARDWVGVRLHLKRVRWYRGEEMLWEVGLCCFCKPQQYVSSKEQFYFMLILRDQIIQTTFL